LETVIERASGQEVAAFATTELFRKIGMKDTRLYDYGGSAWLYAEMRTTTRDMARLGALMLRRGEWNGERVVSADYVARATARSRTSPRMGYAWWLFDASTGLDGFYASGYLNNDIYVFPAADLVIVRTQSPRQGFSGKNESGDYFAKAIPIFAKLTK